MIVMMKWVTDHEVCHVPSSSRTRLMLNNFFLIFINTTILYRLLCAQRLQNQAHKISLTGSKFVENFQREPRKGAGPNIKKLKRK